MDEELLLKEKEYYEINRKLEKRARELLQQVDNIKVHSTDDLHASVSKLEQRSKSVACIQQNSAIPFTPDELKALKLPQDVNNVGTKGFVHFLKSKVKQLQFDLDKLSQEHKSKTDEVVKLGKQNGKLNDDKEKFMQQGNIARNHITKLEHQVELAKSKLQAKDGENIALKKDVDSLHYELRTIKVVSKNNEARYQHALDELNKLKISLRSMKQDDKDMKESHRKHSTSMNDVIKRLEKQKVDLLHGFKRQYVLVDNLKRQKAHIESIKLTDKLESDFIKLVNEDPPKH